MEYFLINVPSSSSRLSLSEYLSYYRLEAQQLFNLTSDKEEEKEDE